jgi:hypothetical protein
MTKENESVPSAKEPDDSQSMEIPTSAKEAETPSPVITVMAPEKSLRLNSKWWCAARPISDGEPLHALHNGADPEDPPEGLTLTLCQHIKITDDFPIRYREPTCEKCRKIIEFILQDRVR